MISSRQMTRPFTGCFTHEFFKSNTYALPHDFFNSIPVILGLAWSLDFRHTMLRLVLHLLGFGNLHVLYIVQRVVFTSLMDDGIWVSA